MFIILFRNIMYWQMYRFIRFSVANGCGKEGMGRSGWSWTHDLLLWALEYWKEVEACIILPYLVSLWKKNTVNYFQKLYSMILLFILYDFGVLCNFKIFCSVSLKCICFTWSFQFYAPIILLSFFHFSLGFYRCFLVTLCPEALLTIVPRNSFH